MSLHLTPLLLESSRWTCSTHRRMSPSIPDGGRHGVLNSTLDSMHSGFIQAAPQDRIGLAQAPLGVTRFRVTFSKPGVYPFICALHDGLGMTGTVNVLP